MELGKNHDVCTTFLFIQDIVQKVMKGDFGSLSDSDPPTTKSKIIFFVSSTFTDTQAERNHLMKGMFNSDTGGSRVFPRGVRQLQNWNYFADFFAENCIKMKEFYLDTKDLAESYSTSL